MRRALSLILLGACGHAAAPAQPHAPPPSDAVAAPSARDAALAQLDDRSTLAIGVRALEALCDPTAIPAIGAAWTRDGQPRWILDVIIALARPGTCTPDGAWDAAAPILRDALAGTSADNAIPAATALGESGSPDAVVPLIAALQQAAPPGAPVQRVRLAALTALARFDDPAAIAALVAVVDAAATEPVLTLAAAIDAVGDARRPEALSALLLAMYRAPTLFTKTERALVRLGPAARPELRRILRGEHAEVNAVVDATTSVRDYDAAIVIGDLHDDAAVPDLLAALDRPLRPAYVVDGAAGPPAHDAILDALRRIGAPASAARVLRIVADAGTRKHPADVDLRSVAAAVYPYVSARGAERVGGKTGVQILGKLAADKHAAAPLRLAAGAALGLLLDDVDAAAPLQAQAAASTKAAAAQRKLADGKARTRYEAAARKLAELATARLAAHIPVDRWLSEHGIEDEQAADPALLDAVRRAEEAVEAYRPTFEAATQQFHALEVAAIELESAAAALTTAVAQIELAARCAGDTTCLLAAFDAEPGDLRDAQLERAVLELRRGGALPADALSPLLARMVSPAYLADRAVRTAILLALPRLAPPPCPVCDDGLAAVIAADAGRADVSVIDADTRLVAAYFASGG